MRRKAAGGLQLPNPIWHHSLTALALLARQAAALPLLGILPTFAVWRLSSALLGVLPAALAAYSRVDARVQVGARVGSGAACRPSMPPRA